MNHGPRGFEHCARGVVLARDQAHGVGFVALFLAHELGDFGVGFSERRLAPLGGIRVAHSVAIAFLASADNSRRKGAQGTAPGA